MYYGLTLRRLIFWLILVGLIIAGAVLANKNGENIQSNQETIQDFVSAPSLMIQKNAAMLAQIRKCESGDRHYLNGKVIVSKTGDIGLYQINLKTWQKEAERLGYDIWTPEGNQEMAYHILATQGLRAWVCYRIIIKK